MTVTYTVLLRGEPEGGYSVVVPALAGCFTCGDTIAEALRMAEEAIGCYVESILLSGDCVPEEGPTVSVETEGLREGFLFRVSAHIDKP